MRSSQVVTAILAACFCLQFPAWSEGGPSATIKSGSIIEVRIDHQVRMRKGAPVVAHTAYPLYRDNRLVLPAGTEVKGEIASLRPVPRTAHLAALARADFTPLHQAILRFDSLVLRDGSVVPVEAVTSRGGVFVVRFSTLPPGPPGRRTSRAHRLFSQAVSREKAMVSGYTSLRRWPAFKRFVFAQLPLHPQYVEAGLQYTLRLSDPLTLPFAEAASEAPAQPAARANVLQHAAIVSAKLLTPIDSKTAVQGMPVKAIVTQPLLNAKNQVEVPQNSLLIGVVTQAKAARKFNRDGTLRFAFRQMQFPAGYTQPVHGTAQAVMADQKQNLQIDAEGGAQAQPKSALAPIALSLLAAEASHDDELTTDATASNGFALLGHFMVLAPGSQYIAATMAATTASHSIYDRFLRHGTDVSFPRNTRIEIAVDPVHSPLMHLSDKK
jgi:hypothetical protein